MEDVYVYTMEYYEAMKNYVVESHFLRYGLRKNGIRIS